MLRQRVAPRTPFALTSRGRAGFSADTIGHSGACAEPPPLPTPNLGIYCFGEVYAVARLPDGSVVVGGRFTSVYEPFSQLTIDRNNLAKFSASGALDLAWNPSANGAVYALR